jgi:short subunit fatty acids transporter
LYSFDLVKILYLNENIKITSSIFNSTKILIILSLTYSSIMTFFIHKPKEKYWLDLDKQKIQMVDLEEEYWKPEKQIKHIRLESKNKNERI